MKFLMCFLITYKKIYLHHKTHKFYFDYGTTSTIEEYYPRYAPKVNAVFAKKGYDTTNFKNLKFEGAYHTENSWNKRLDIPLMFLLKK